MLYDLATDPSEGAHYTGFMLPPVEYSFQTLIVSKNDGGKGENHSLRGLLPVSYNLFIRNNINYKSLNIGKMITNQVMKRPMGNFLVEQRTKDSMFNATNLLKQWNEFVEYKDFYCQFLMR